jgi:hypothetical protein
MFYLLVSLVPVCQKDIHTVIFFFVSVLQWGWRAHQWPGGPTDTGREGSPPTQRWVLFSHPPGEPVGIQIKLNGLSQKKEASANIYCHRKSVPSNIHHENERSLFHLVPTVHKAAGRKLMVLEDHSLLLQNTAKLHYRRMARNPWIDRSSDDVRVCTGFYQCFGSASVLCGSGSYLKTRSGSGFVPWQNIIGICKDTCIKI